MSQVNEWKQSGEVFVWCYPDGSKNYGGWHLTATNSGAISLTSLMDAFEAEANFRHRKVQLSQVNANILSVPNYNSKTQSPIAIILDFNSSGDHSNQWKLEIESESVLRLKFGLKKLAELRTAFAGIPSGEGDYSIGPENQKDAKDQDLWIWWHPSTRIKGAV